MLYMREIMIFYKISHEKKPYEMTRYGFYQINYTY